MMCDCTEKISLLVDGELSASDAREVERHLLTCEECQRTRADFLSVRSELSAFRSSAPQIALRKELARILGPGATELPSAPRKRSFAWSFGPAAAFATLIIASAVIALLFVRPFTKQQQMGTGAVATASPQPVTTGPESKPSPVPEESPRKETPAEQTKEPKNGPASPSRRRGPVSAPAPKPGEQFALNTEPVRSADAQTMTVLHFEKSEFLLRSFRNVRIDSGSVAEVKYEKKRAQQLVYQNMILRREAEASGDVQTSTLLESLEPILLDIANLPEKPRDRDVQVIKDRVERKNIVPLLQVNSAALARALD
jgi:hypothetical protein